MRALFYRYNSICEPDYIEAFKTIGLEVSTIEIEMLAKNLTLEKKVEILGEKVLTEKPLFIFSINYFPFIAMVCEKLKYLYVCVSVDCPVVELFSTTIKSPYNRVFLFDQSQYEDVKDYNPDCIYHLPLGVDVNRIDNTIGKPDFESINYKYDVSFVGSLYNEKDSYMDIRSCLSKRTQGYCDGLIEAQLLFHGQELLEDCVTEEVIDELKKCDKNFYPAMMNVVNTDRFVAVNNYLSYHITHIDRVLFLNRIAKIADIHFFTRSDTFLLKGVNIHGGVSSLKEMPLVFRESKININHTMRAIKIGLPQRIWDVLGSGGFLLSNYQSELPKYLEIGKHLAAYETAEEAEELISYYLTHEDERLEIANAGYLFAKENNQVVNRVSTMIKTVLESIENRV
ncbi:MAG: DUF3880 domain-containing protein [Lachnospiraceae bacterium]|nr:DUF3880 domain-containing protein [Lachnospiraceae bacterium]